MESARHNSWLRNHVPAMRIGKVEFVIHLVSMLRIEQRQLLKC